MTAKELERLMLQTEGNPLIKLKRISELVGDTNQTRVRREYLDGLKQIRNRYFIPEVAERIASKMH